MAPIKVAPNQPPARFYAGGKQIAGFRGLPSYDDYTPEDWVGSISCCLGQKSLGLSSLPDGTQLVAAIKQNPEWWLGPEHVSAFGADTKILVKLLDAGQRLPIHAHPHGSWAKEHVGAAHGKAEAWFTLTPGKVHLGLKQDIAMPELLSLVTEQRNEELLRMRHCISVEPYQTIYIPPGLLHAIGEGILLVEIQEPEDLSILLEWQGFNIDGMTHGHLGLGFERALTGVESTKRTNAEIEKLVTPAGALGEVLAPDCKEYFRLECLKVSREMECEGGFAVLIVLDGALQIETRDGQVVNFVKGETAVVGHGDGSLLIRGEGTIIVARPPRYPV